MYENLDRVISRMENLKSADYFHECAKAQGLQQDSDVCIAEILLRETDLCQMVTADRISDSRLNEMISYFTFKTGVSPQKTAEIISRLLGIAHSSLKINRDTIGDYSDAVRKYNYGWTCNVDTDEIFDKLCADAENGDSPTCHDSINTLIEMHKKGNRKATVFLVSKLDPLKDGEMIVEMLKDAYESGMPSAAGELARFYAQHGFTVSSYNKALEYYRKPGAVLGCRSPRDVEKHHECIKQLNDIVVSNRTMKIIELLLCVVSTIITLVCITGLPLWFSIPAAVLGIASAAYIVLNIRRDRIMSPYGILIFQGFIWIPLLFYLI